MAEEYDTLDDVERFELDMSFHRAITHAAHNEMLAETHSSYLARLWRARYLSAIKKRSRDRVLAQHKAIADGLERRDLKMARQHLDEHLAHLVTNVREYFLTEEETGDAGSSKS